MGKRFKEKFRRNKCEIINSIPPNEYSDKVGLRGARYQVYKLLSKVNGGLYLSEQGHVTNVHSKCLNNTFSCIIFYLYSKVNCKEVGFIPSHAI